MQKMIEQLQKMTVVQPRSNIQNDNLIIQNNQHQLTLHKMSISIHGLKHLQRQRCI